MTWRRLLTAGLLGVFNVGLTAAGAADAPSRADSLRVAVHVNAIRDTSRTDLEVSLKVWSKELMQVLKLPAEVSFYDDPADIHRDLLAGRVNFVIADLLTLLRHFQPDELADGFGGRAPNEDSLLLIARREAGADKVRDLAGRRIALLSDNELSDLWLDTFCLRTFRSSCSQAGIQVVRESRSQQQILAVFFGKADAALVRGYPYALAQELNPQIANRTQILERAEIYPAAVGLFASRVSPEFREYVIRKVPELHDHPRGRQLLEVMQTERVGRYPKAVLEPARRLLQENESLHRRLAPGGKRP